MLDQMLVERKGVVGKDGLMERQHGGRITRSLRLAWERRKPINFDGSISEWNNGRKKREEAKERERLGLPPQLEEGEVKVGVGDAEKDAASGGFPHSHPLSRNRRPVERLTKKIKQQNPQKMIQTKTSSPSGVKPPKPHANFPLPQQVNGLVKKARMPSLLSLPAPPPNLTLLKTTA